MASLTEASIFSKKAFVFLVLFVGALILLIIFFSIFNSFKNSLFPPKAPPSTVAFGKLPEVDLSEGVKPAGQIDFKVETISGSLPQLRGEAKVFEIKGSESSFGAEEKAKRLAVRAGFDAEPKNIGGNFFEFREKSEEEMILVIDSDTGNFRLTSNYITNPKILGTRPRSADNSIQAARDFFSFFGIKEIDFPLDKIETKYMRIDGNTLTKTFGLSSANLVEVDFVRAPLDGLGVISPKRTESLTWALVSEKGVVAGEFLSLPIEKFKFSTYPLKTVDKAFEELKTGRGAFNDQPLTSQFPIRTVEIAYLETAKNQGFLQPVYLFKGNEGLAAYVPAVANSWINSGRNNLPPLP